MLSKCWFSGTHSSTTTPSSAIFSLTLFHLAILLWVAILNHRPLLQDGTGLRDPHNWVDWICSLSLPSNSTSRGPLSNLCLSKDCLYWSLLTLHSSSDSFPPSQAPTKPQPDYLVTYFIEVTDNFNMIPLNYHPLSLRFLYFSLCSPFVLIQPEVCSKASVFPQGFICLHLSSGTKDLCGSMAFSGLFLKPGSHSQPPSSCNLHLQSYLNQSLWSYLTSTYSAWASKDYSLLWNKPCSLQPLCFCPSHSLLLKCPSPSLYLLWFYTSSPKAWVKALHPPDDCPVGNILSLLCFSKWNPFILLYNMFQTFSLSHVRIPPVCLPCGSWALGDLSLHETHLCNLHIIQPLQWWLVGLGVNYFVYK